MFFSFAIVNNRVPWSPGLRAAHGGRVPRARQRGGRGGSGGGAGPRRAAAGGRRALGGRPRGLQPAQGLPAPAAGPAAHGRNVPRFYR